MSSIPFDRSGIGMVPLDPPSAKAGASSQNTSSGESFENHLKRETEISGTTSASDFSQSSEPEDSGNAEKTTSVKKQESSVSQRETKNDSSDSQEHDESNEAENRQTQESSDTSEKEATEVEDEPKTAEVEVVVPLVAEEENANEELQSGVQDEAKRPVVVEETVTIEEEAEMETPVVATFRSDQEKSGDSEDDDETSDLEIDLEESGETVSVVDGSSFELEITGNGEQEAKEEFVLNTNGEDSSGPAKESSSIPREEKAPQVDLKDTVPLEEKSLHVKDPSEVDLTQPHAERESEIVGQEPQQQNQKERRNSQQQLSYVPHQQEDSSGNKEIVNKESVILDSLSQVDDSESRQNPRESAEVGANTLVKNDSTGEVASNPVRLPQHLMARGQQRAESGLRLTDAEQVRFIQRVARAFQVAQGRDGQIRLRLSPPELGSLRLEVTLHEGVLTARIETETVAARTILLDNLGGLRDRLADMNIKVEQFDVDVMERQPGDQTDRSLNDQKSDERSAQKSPGFSSDSEESTSDENREEISPLGIEGQLNVVI